MDLTPFHGPPAAAPEVPGFVARTLLGFGAHGEVWLADDLSTGGRVALKIGRPAGDPDDPAVPEGPNRTDHETALLCRIDHPHVVRLRRVVPLPGGAVAMVLDLAAGGSLASLVAARGRFDPGEVSTLLVPLAGALEHLHGRGVVHGDIAPGNVLFTGDGRPQLGDLGVARVLGARAGEAWATPGFTDPALGRPGAEGADLLAADLWGLAAVGWFALSGRPPEPAAVRAGAADRSPDLGALLAECLSAAPADRPSLQELSDRAWQAVHPVPIRLVSPRTTGSDDAGLPPLADRVTRRVLMPAGSGTADAGGVREAMGERGVDGALLPMPVPARGAMPPPVPTQEDRPEPVPLQARSAGEHPHGRRSGRLGSGARRRGAGIVAVVAAGSAVAAVGVAAAVRPGALAGAEPTSTVGAGQEAVGAAGGGARQGSAGVAGGSAGQQESPGVAAGPETTEPTAGTSGLEKELTRALIAIGRSRATAFKQASARFLAGADVTGSPAYQQDLELVQRLRARGCRLEGVSYQVSDVKVLHRRGEQVDVRAVVTTSGHRQVRAGASGSAEQDVVTVPADGPRPVVLTVAPVEANLPGPGRWRVRSVQEAS